MSLSVHAHTHTKERQFIPETAPVEQTFGAQGIRPSLRGMGRGSAGARLWGMDRGSAGARLRGMGRGNYAKTALRVIKETK